ncbi:hypothetical protein MC378_08850 [Polaribacter sp. MSW13]|uniref:Outer membrane protein beta-barrel domain-containing protein n=1 Tax=Polaribacter marinus TaxID=2916838 RepID=A0A9X1VR75_9FLAO|nr:hypothetical protein [Polaribacter marinus]MCI2229270.1 hypothetical protein [Polaribacter marinus]
MKKLLLLVLIAFSSLKVTSQEKDIKSFFTSSLNFTLARNEFDEAFGDDEPFFSPAALFLRTGFGYEFQKRIAISFNVGFDYHWNYAVSAFPTYGTVKYNITEDALDTFFVEMSYGKMWRPSSKYADGNYYGFGIGTQIAGEKRWNTIIRIDFHRKGIHGFKNNRLDSFSFGVGFSFF